MHFDKRYILPGVLFLLNIGQAAVFFYSGEWKKGLYFASSGIAVMAAAL